MKVNGFGAYPVRNISSGGQKDSVDEYNKSFKGNAYQHYEEYASRNVEEYHHYSEYNDFKDKQQDNKNDSSQSDDKKQKNARANRQRMLQQVVGLVAGSVVVVTSYQSVLKQQAQAVEEPTSVVQSVDSGDYDPDGNNDADNVQPIEKPTQEATTQPDQEETTTQPDQEETTTQPDQEKTSTQHMGEVTISRQQGGQVVTTPEGFRTSWSWSKDNNSATLKVTDNRGNVIKEIPAGVTVSQTAATCTKAGMRKYTATAEYNNKKYSDTKTETFAALGHKFDNGKETVLENGQTVITYECSRCHEKISIKTSVTEID